MHLLIAEMLTAERTVEFFLRSACGEEECVSGSWGGLWTCVFTHNTQRFRSQTNPTWAPATLLCSGSSTSSPITGPPFPLWAWMGFQSLNCCCYNWVESMWKWKPAAQEDFSPLVSPPRVRHYGSFVFVYLPTRRTTCSWVSVNRRLIRLNISEVMRKTLVLTSYTDIQLIEPLNATYGY